MTRSSAPRTAFIALGSNLGDRHAHLALARARIAELPHTVRLAASTIEETAPLGGLAQAPYLNQMVAVRTSLAPLDLLERLHAIEREAGRVRRERWGPRTLDLDIVVIDGESLDDVRLVLPHPGLASRDFWQRELDELRCMLMAPPETSPERVEPPHGLTLPSWAVVGERRRAHIERVTALLDAWAAAMDIDAAERQAWHDAGAWHDALRDADEPTLRALSGDATSPVAMLHGPAAAARLAREGERRQDVLDAVRYHTVGWAQWGRTGRALYMADYLEPGRSFAREARARLAAHVATDFDDVFRTVVRERVEWALREGKSLHARTVDLRNAVR